MCYGWFMQTKATFPNLPLPRLVKMLATKHRMKRPLKHPGETQAEYLKRIGPLGPFGKGMSALQIANAFNTTKHSVNVLLNLARLELEVLESVERFDRGGIGISRAQVFKVGFFIDADTRQPANGRRSTVNVIVPSRAQQLRLLKRYMDRAT